jgi:signal transduction histidine kinase
MRGPLAAGNGKSEPDDGLRGPLIAPLLAETIVAVVFAGFCLVAFQFVLSVEQGLTPSLLLSVCYLLVLLSLQVFYFSRPTTRLQSPLTYAVIVVQACLVYLPMVQFGSAWIGLPSLLAGTILLVLPAALAWPAFAAIVVSVGWVLAALGGTTLDVAYNTVAIITVSLEVYGLTRLARLVTELHEARNELANTAVAHERLRFARDLHDLLGLSLSAIAPKGELALRLLHRHAERAKQELSEILDIARRALADVRSVARGYRELSLDDEMRTVESVLAASDVELRMAVNHGELPVRTRTLLATVLREGVTNVLRHSRATRCEIVLQRDNATAVLDIVNDGVVDNAAREPYAGSGINNLSQRAATSGGQLSARVDPDGRFRLHLSVPMSPPRSQTKGAGPVDVSGEDIPRDAIQPTNALIAVVFCGIFLIGGLKVPYVTQDPVTIAASVGYMVVVLLLQLFYVSRPDTRLDSRTSYAVLSAQAVLVYLPLLQFGADEWTSARGFLAGTVLLVLRPALAWVAFTAIMASVGLVTAVSTGLLVEVVFSMVGAVLSGLVVYGLTWMARTLAELRATRRKLAEVAVAEERLRFARDLHDLLGLSLSAITLKCQLAHRLVTSDPDRVARELAEILAIARKALADVRSVASGYRDLSLDEETRSAESLLVAADVDVRMDVHHGALPARVGTVLATVLREGVTNVLRHSSGEYCEITLRHRDDAVCLDIVNDGVVTDSALARYGSGIHNLADRVATLGGELTAGLDPDGRFRLRAWVPA